MLAQRRLNNDVNQRRIEMNKQEQLSYLQQQLEDIKQQIEKLKEPETCYVVVHKAEDMNWYKTGEVYKVFSELTMGYDGYYHELVNQNSVGVSPNHITKISDPEAIKALEASSIKDKR